MTNWSAEKQPPAKHDYNRGDVTFKGLVEALTGTDMAEHKYYRHSLSHNMNILKTDL